MLSTLPMATGSSDGATDTVTCPTCDCTVPQAPGTKRTICPNCGNFYDQQTAANPPAHRRLRRDQADRGYPNLKDNADGGNKSGGRLQTITNFFQNLTPSRRGSQNSIPRSTNSSPGLEQSRTKMELPPIDSSNHLTSPNTSSAPSYLCPSPSSNGSGTSSMENRQGTSPRSPISPRFSPVTSNSSQPNQSAAKGKVHYPVRTKTAEQLQEDIQAAQENGNWKPLQDFYSTTFDSFVELNAAFKRDPAKDYKTTDDSGIKLDFVNFVYDTLLKLPQEIQKTVLKAIINSLLKDKKPNSKDDLRAYLVLLQNPQFTSLPTYVIFAHLLRQIAALSDHDHHYLVHWLTRLSKVKFKAVLDRLHNFISCRLFPPKPQDLPPMSKCTWWMPSATKVMALLNAANNLVHPSVVPYTDFYNSTLDHLDLMAEYYAWQNPSTQGGFSFCQYPFILSIAAKRTILQKDSEQQMIVMARKSLVAKVQRRQLPDIGMLFLNLNVRRSHLVSDSLNEIARKKHDLKKKLKVTFSGEPGLDMGGLTKEWFLLLIRQIFKPEYGMFTYDKKSGVFWFSSTQCENYQEFNLVGVLMGLAVYNSINLDVRFPPCCYKKLLNPAVVPFNNPRATVGVTNVSLEDFRQVQPDVARGLHELLEYDGDVEGDFGLTFQISQTEFGATKSVPLKPGGEDIFVTSENRKEYVQRYVDFVLNRSIYPQFQAFYHGFHSVCASNALIMLRPEEVEMLVCGNPTLNMADLKKVTQYDGFTAQDPVIRNFWDIVLHMPLDFQKKLMLFATGSDRVPIGGMSEMYFKITRVEGADLLPMSHTCFNQLVLPSYKSRRVLKQKLIAAIQNAEGFGLE